MKKLTSILLIATTIIVLTSCAARSGMNSTAQNTTENKEAILEAVAVETLVVEEKAYEEKAYIIGKIESNEEYNVMPYTTGIVDEILVNVGDMVEEGDVLYVLNSTDLELSKNTSLSQAEASMKQSKSRLELAQKDLEQNQINLAKSQKDYDDNKKLYDSGYISEEQFTNIKKALESAQISYDRSTLSLSIEQSSYDQAVNSYNNSKLDFDSKFEKMTVQSPISGMVTKIDVKKDVTNTGNTGITITNIKDMKVSANIFEKEINKIAIGQPATVLIDSIGITVEGIVSSVAYSSSTNYYPIEVSIENKDNLLKAGMFAEVSINIGETDSILAVPKTSIVSEESSKYVFVNKDNYASKIKVTTGSDFGNIIEVLDGIVMGQELVVKGQAFLDEGTPLLLK